MKRRVTTVALDAPALVGKVHAARAPHHDEVAGEGDVLILAQDAA